jgi:predicted transcriptional regulator YdeE
MKKEVRIEQIGPLELIGVVQYGDPKIVQFHTSWDHFGKIVRDLSLSIIGKDLYGLQIYPPWFPSRFEITYMASMEKENKMDVPIRMLSKLIPQSTYVVQKVDGGINGIDKTLRYLYEDYIPKNKFIFCYPFDFEKYCNIENQDAFFGDIELWVPIRKDN